MNDRATFARMEASTQDDWRKIGAEFMPFARRLPDRLMAHLKVLEGDYGGFPFRLRCLAAMHGFSRRRTRPISGLESRRHGAAVSSRNLRRCIASSWRKAGSARKL